MLVIFLHTSQHMSYLGSCFYHHISNSSDALTRFSHSLSHEISLAVLLVSSHKPFMVYVLYTLLLPAIALILGLPLFACPITSSSSNTSIVLLFHIFSLSLLCQNIPQPLCSLFCCASTFNFSIY